MTVGWILREKGRNVVTASVDSRLIDVIKLLAEKRIGAIVITDASHKIAGIISERDVVRTLAREGAEALDKPVSAFMTRKVLTCCEHHTVDWLMEQMTSGRFRHMPVVENGALAGVVSIGDVVKYKIMLAEAEAGLMRQYIATG